MSSYKYIFLYVSKIALFSLLYWTCFYLNADSFHLSRSLNISPISTAKNLWESSDNASEKVFLDRIYSNSDEHRKVTQLLNKKRALDFEIYDLRERLEDAREKHEEAYAVLESSRSSEIDAYKEKNITPLEDENERLRNSALSSSSASNGVSSKIIENLNSIVEFHNYIVANFGTFGSADAINTSKSAYDAMWEIEGLFNEAKSKRAKIRGEYYEIWTRGRAVKLSQVSFFDFVYFSACISTTTTFGDIIPNSRWVRVLVVMQLIAGIIILSMLVSSIKERKL